MPQITHCDSCGSSNICFVESTATTGIVSCNECEKVLEDNTVRETEGEECQSALTQPEEPGEPQARPKTASAPDAAGTVMPPPSDQLPSAEKLFVEGVQDSPPAGSTTSDLSTSASIHTSESSEIESSAGSDSSVLANGITEADRQSQPGTESHFRHRYVRCPECTATQAFCLCDPPFELKSASVGICAKCKQRVFPISDLYNDHISQCVCTSSTRGGTTLLSGASASEFVIQDMLPEQPPVEQLSFEQLASDHEAMILAQRVFIAQGQRDIWNSLRGTRATPDFAITFIEGLILGSKLTAMRGAIAKQGVYAFLDKVTKSRAQTEKTRGVTPSSTDSFTSPVGSDTHAASPAPSGDTAAPADDNTLVDALADTVNEFVSLYDTAFKAKMKLEKRIKNAKDAKHYFTAVDPLHLDMRKVPKQLYADWPGRLNLAKLFHFGRQEDHKEVKEVFARHTEGELNEFGYNLSRSDPAECDRLQSRCKVNAAARKAEESLRIKAVAFCNETLDLEIQWLESQLHWADENIDPIRPALETRLDVVLADLTGSTADVAGRQRTKALAQFNNESERVRVQHVATAAKNVITARANAATAADSAAKASKVASTEGVRATIASTVGRVMNSNKKPAKPTRAANATRSDGGRKSAAPNIVCDHCNKPGHSARRCRNQVCEHCGGKGHAKADCYKWKQEQKRQTSAKSARNRSRSRSRSPSRSSSSSSESESSSDQDSSESDAGKDRKNFDSDTELSVRSRQLNKRKRKRGSGSRGGKRAQAKRARQDPEQAKKHAPQPKRSGGNRKPGNPPAAKTKAAKQNEKKEKKEKKKKEKKTK